MTRRFSLVPAALRTRMGGLLLLNAALLGTLAVVSLGGRADAQVRARGSYLMVPGGAAGTDAEVAWIVDTTNEALVALTWDPNQKELVGVGYRSLARDAVQVGAVRGR